MWGSGGGVLVREWRVRVGECGGCRLERGSQVCVALVVKEKG